MQTVTAGGIEIPKLGFGTWPMKGPECTDAVLRALGRGYRHVDTAAIYENEAAVGEALATCDIPREDIHLTTKVWHDSLEPAAIERAIEASLAKLQTDYVDLYLVHWPSRDMRLADTLGAMLRLREDGMVRAIGVSNFPLKLLQEAWDIAGEALACNQVEYHVNLDQSKLLGFMRPRGIALTAYAPLGTIGRKGSKIDTVLEEIALKHDATPAQVALKWLLDQEGVIAVPKAQSDDRQQENLAAQQIALDAADRAAIATMPKNIRLINPDFAPAWD